MTDPAREAAERIVGSPNGYTADSVVVAKAYLALPTAGDREARVERLVGWLKQREHKTTGIMDYNREMASDLLDYIDAEVAIRLPSKHEVGNDREALAKIVDPFPWTYGMNGVERDYEGPEDAEADKEKARHIADAILAWMSASGFRRDGVKP